MISINAQTKIATLLKENPAALEAIISISPKFNKLRNPLLRKIMAARTSIKMASVIGGCSVHVFFEKLKPLGFSIDERNMEEDNKKETAIEIPDFVHHISQANIVELDVREDIKAGKDPLSIIMQAVKKLEPSNVLKLINTFEPFPLIVLLEKQGFEYYVETKNDDLVYTYFHSKNKAVLVDVDTSKAAEGWDEMYKKYTGNMTTVDVRHLEMPMPMHVILESLDKLEDNKALYVVHKRIPVFLLPELADRKFDYRINEVKDGEVYLLIFRM